MIQCTSPFLSSDDLKNSKDKIFEKESKSHSLLSGYLSNKFIWQEKNEFWHSKNYDPSSRPRTQESKKYFVENGAFYIFSESNYQINKCRLHGNIDIYVMEELRSIDIDEEEDLKLSRHLYGFLKA